MEFVIQLIEEYVKDPKFLLDAGITFVILDALQEIKYIDALSNEYKKLASIIIAAVLAPFIIEPSFMGVVAGVFAGASLTMVVDRVQIIAKMAGGKEEPQA